MGPIPFVVGVKRTPAQEARMQYALTIYARSGASATPEQGPRR